ncbi:MAG: hypothetical protein HY329_00085 [Chloroflexi bacterium]|nr:hypothetical protein [Chloroflexota bacterium]
MTRHPSDDDALAGTRARIGFLTPAPGTSSIRELRRLMPPGVLPIFATMHLEQISATGLSGVIQQLEGATKQVALANPDVVVQIAASASLADTPNADEEIVSRMRAVHDVPAFTAMQGAVSAFRALGLRRLIVLVPYTNDMCERIRQYLIRHDLDPVTVQGMGISAQKDVHQQGPGAAYRQAKEVSRSADSADGIFFCTGGRASLEILDWVEKDTGLPVVSTNTATAWWALRLAQVREPMSGFGRLLAEFP